MEQTFNAAQENRIREHCLNLMQGKFICYENTKTRADYKEIVSDYIDTIRKRLKSVGYELIKSETEKAVFIIPLTDVSAKCYSLDLVESRVLLHLTKQYITGFTNIRNSSTIYYKWNDLLKDMEDAIKSNQDKRRIRDAVWLFKDLQIIDINVNKNTLKEADLDDNVVITIYPTVKCLCQLNKLTEVEDKLRAYKNSNINKGDKEISQHQTAKIELNNYYTKIFY